MVFLFLKQILSLYACYYSLLSSFHGLAYVYMLPLISHALIIPLLQSKARKQDEWNFESASFKFSPINFN